MRLVAVALFVLLSNPALVAQPDESQAVRDCTADALRFCKRAIATGSRNSIIVCMIANRDKLQLKCSRHLQ